MSYMLCTSPVLKHIAVAGAIMIQAPDQSACSLARHVILQLQTLQQCPAMHRISLTLNGYCVVVQ